MKDFNSYIFKPDFKSKFNRKQNSNLIKLKYHLTKLSVN